MEIEEFCKYCDFGQNGLNDCGIPESQEKYACKEWCGCSSTEGVRTETTSDYILIIPTCEKISRSNTKRLQEAINEGVKAGKSVFRTPKISPLTKALAVK